MTDIPDNIVQIDVLRLNRKVPKKCKCKSRQYTVDTTNREITCGCGMVVDPFEALYEMARDRDYFNKQHLDLNEQRRKWLREKPKSVMFKALEKSYSDGKMLPYCPECKKLFDYKDIKAHGNAQFYRKLEEQKP